MMRFFALRIITFLLLVSQASFAQLTITASGNTPGNTLQDLVNSLVGDGVIVQNVVCNQSQTSNHYGRFEYVTTTTNPFGPMGIKDGLVMCTGVLTPNADNPTGGIVGTAPTTSGSVIGAQTSTGLGDTTVINGHRYLRRALLSSGSTNPLTNVISIEFDVIPSSDTISFKYVFASEEYPGFVCSNFNDIFGFFISGPGIQSNQGLPPNVRNIALIPNTNTPVSINTVNGGVSAGTSTSCILTNTQFFRNNRLATSPTFSLMRFGGYTIHPNPNQRVLEARVPVIRCQTYRLCLSLANVQDQSFQSGVFIEKGSLRSFGAEVKSIFEYNHRTGLQNAVEGCNAGKLQFSRVPNVPPSLEIKTAINIYGTAINGIDYYALDSASNAPLRPDSTLPDTVTLETGVLRKTVLLIARKDTIIQGMRTIQIGFRNACMQTDTSVQINIYDYFPFNAGADQHICRAGDPVNDLQVGDTILPTDKITWYKIDPISADTIAPFPELSCNNCMTPTVSPMDTTTTFVLRIQDGLSGCEGLDTVSIFIYNPKIATRSQGELLADTACDRRELKIFARATTEVGTLTYEWTIPDSLFYRQFPTGASIKPLPEDSVISVMSEKLPINDLKRSDWFHVKALTELAGCFVTDSVLVTIVKQPESRNLDTLICFGTSLPLSQSLMNYRFVDIIGKPQYRWQPNYAISDTSSPFPVLAPRRNLDASEGNTRYRLLLNNGACIIPRTVLVAITDSLASAYQTSFTNDTIIITQATFSNQSYDFITPNLSTTRRYQWRLKPESSSLFLLDTTLNNTDSISVEISEPGFYLMMLRSELLRIYNGQTYTCLDSTTQRFYVKPEVIPNIITPGTTLGANDMLKLPPGNITIYNRWGKKVFEAETAPNNTNSQWDAAQLPAGTYFYMYQSRRTGEVQKGWIQVVR